MSICHFSYRHCVKNSPNEHYMVYLYSVVLLSIDCLLILGHHVGAVVTTAASQQVQIMLGQSCSVRTLHVLPKLVWVIYNQNMHIG